MFSSYQAALQPWRSFIATSHAARRTHRSEPSPPVTKGYSRPGSSRGRNCSRGPRIQQVPQPVAHQVEAQDGQRDGTAREDGEPWVHGKEILGLLEHEAPGGMRRLRAQAKVGESGLGQDG